MLVCGRLEVGAKSHALCLNNALAGLANRGCSELEDPLGISGLIKAAYTEPMRERATDATRSLAQRAYIAIMSEREGSERMRSREAMGAWVNHKFRRNV